MKQKPTENVCQAALEVRRQLDENPFTKKTATEYAREHCIPRAVLQKAFKEITGKGIRLYQIENRLQIGKKQLEQSDKSVKEIAILCRFRDQQYFARVFRKKHSMSPTEWRERHHKVEQ